MPHYEDEFNEALHRARRAFFRGEAIPRRQVEQLYREFAEMLVRIESEAGSGIITAERAEGLRRSILREMARYGVRLERLVISGVGSAAETAAAAHEEALRRAAEAAGVRVSHSFDTVPRRALENMMMRRGIDIISDRGRGGVGRGGLSGTFETLVRRRIRNLQPEIDRVLTSAVARGQSAGRLTRDLALTMSRDDPKLSLALERTGSRGRRLNRLLQEGKFDEITDIPQVRSLLYDSRRIAVSEINNAHYESDRLAAAESPVVDLLRWLTSGRHDSLKSSPDACTAAREADTAGYGPGLYHPDTCPSLLHPHCVLPHTLVSASVETAMKSYFSGDAVEVTAGDNKVSVTANHPMLTARGIVKAGDLVDTDKLLTYCGEANAGPRVGADVNEGPVRADEIFDTLSKDGSRFSVKRSPEYLHGEARFGEGDIDVVRADGKLLLDINSPTIKHCRQLGFMDTDIIKVGVVLASTLDFTRQGVLAAAQRLMRRLCMLDSRLRVLGKDSRPRHFASFGNASSLDTALPQNALDDRAAYTVFMRKLIFGNPGLVSFSNISSIRKFNFSGHVYDFESDTGYMAANNMLISNCACNTLKVLRKPSAWDQPKRLVPEPRFLDEKEMSKFLDVNFEDNKGFVRGQLKMFNAKVRSAHQAIAG